MTSAAAKALSLDTLSITDTQRYVERGYSWAEWDLLRRVAPVYWYERPDVDPFWALTTYEDTLTVSKRSDIFVSTQRLRIFPRTQEEFARRHREELIRASGRRRRARFYTLSFIDMDDPEHAAYRNLTNRSFTPRAMRLLEEHIAALARVYASSFARQLVDAVAGQGECDFVRDLAVKLPMAAIFEILGRLPPRGLGGALRHQGDRVRLRPRARPLRAQPRSARPRAAQGDQGRHRVRLRLHRRAPGGRGGRRLPRGRAPARRERRARPRRR